MKLLRIGLDGDYVYQERLQGHPQTVRIPGTLDKPEARKRAKLAFDELKNKLANGTATILESGRLVLKGE